MMYRPTLYRFEMSILLRADSNASDWSKHSCGNLQEELSGTGVEDENSAVNWFVRQVTLERFVNQN